MNKRNSLLIVTFFLIIIILLALKAPGSLRQMEATDFFLSDSDFFFQKLAFAPGITSWLSLFLMQFFIMPVVGAFIFALIYSLSALFATMIAVRANSNAITSLSFVAPIAIAILSPLNLTIALQTLFFFVFLWGGICIKNSLFKSIYLIGISLIGFFFIPWLLLVINILTIAIHALLPKPRSILLIGCTVVAIIVSVADVYMSNQFIGFIPFKNRFFNSPTADLSLPLYLFIYILSVILLFIPFRKRIRINELIPGCIILLIFGGLLIKNLLSEKVTLNEQCIRYSILADEHQWQTLLEEIPHETTSTNKISLTYALLAESALGTLPEHLFNYYISDPEDFLFRHEMKRFCCIFNRQFYENLGIYDEAFRQAFEYGVMSPEGYCFSSLKHMIHYAILEGDFKMAEKYLNTLERATLYKSWVAEKRQELKRQQANYHVKKKLYSDTFVSVYPMNSEMVRQLSFNPQNKKALDYLLCGLLIKRDLQKFSIIMKGFPLYKNQPLPKAYAEAAGMLANIPNYSLHGMFNYPAEFEQLFAEYYKMRQQNSPNATTIEQKFLYWKFYFLAPAQGDQEE